MCYRLTMLNLYTIALTRPDNMQFPQVAPRQPS